ncbi:MAG TPA: fibronectin type III domain-containing protein [Terriglobales bacterium]
MKKLSLNVAIVLAAGNLFQSMPSAAKVSPTTEKAASVHITKGPAIERADPDFAIIRWTSNNPGGSPEHYAVVHYGTDPRKLDLTAESPIRLNPTNSYTIFRVRMDGLKPGTTYYYKVESTEANGQSDGVKSTIQHFTTPE